jgi:hypothetical protein
LAGNCGVTRGRIFDIDNQVLLGDRFYPQTPASSAATADTGIPVAAWLIGGVAFLTAVLTAIGADAANVDRVRVNYAGWFTAAILAVILAILLGVLYPVIKSDRRRKWAVLGGVVLLGAAIVGITYMTTTSLSAKSRPRMIAKLERADSGDNVTGSVTAAGLKSSEHIAVRVIGISTRENPSELHVGHARGGETPADRQVLYSSRTGPDSGGATTVEFAVPVGSGLYERLDVEAELIEEDG